MATGKQRRQVKRCIQKLFNQGVPLERLGSGCFKIGDYYLKQESAYEGFNVIVSPRPFDNDKNALWRAEDNGWIVFNDPWWFTTIRSEQLESERDPHRYDWIGDC